MFNLIKQFIVSSMETEDEKRDRKHFEALELVAEKLKGESDKN